MKSWAQRERARSILAKDVGYIAKPHGNPPQGEIRSKEVTLGLDDGKTVEIKSGLTGDELVIAKGNGVLAEGTAIRAPLGGSDVWRAGAGRHSGVILLGSRQRN